MITVHVVDGSVQFPNQGKSNIYRIDPQDYLQIEKLLKSLNKPTTTKNPQQQLTFKWKNPPTNIPKVKFKTLAKNIFTPKEISDLIDKKQKSRSILKKCTCTHSLLDYGCKCGGQ